MADKIQKNNDLQPLSVTLRKNMTPHERKLWYTFLHNYPVKFYRQRIIGNYIVDFYCASAKLVVELDGSQHYSADGMEADLIRTQYLEKYGLKVLRFTNSQINHYFTDVCREIDRWVKQRNPQTEKKTNSAPAPSAAFSGISPIGGDETTDPVSPSSDS